MNLPLVLLKEQFSKWIFCKDDGRRAGSLFCLWPQVHRYEPTKAAESFSYTPEAVNIFGEGGLFCSESKECLNNYVVELPLPLFPVFPPLARKPKF